MSVATGTLVKCSSGWIMTITLDRLKLPLAFALVTIFTAHLLWYPFYGEHFARLGDQHAAHALERWHRWNPVFIASLIAGWAVLYMALRRSDDRPPIIAGVASAAGVLAIIVLEILLMFLCGYVRYWLFDAK